MSFKTIDRETVTLLESGALRKLETSELLREQTKFAGRVVVITGAGSGLGRAFAVHAATNGAKVVIGDVNMAGLDETLQLITAVRGTATGTRCDVTSWDDQLKLFALAEERYGRVDVVVANAGIGDAAPMDFTQSELTKPNLKTIDIDVVGVVYTARIGLHHMRKNPATEGKTLILIASYAAFYGSPLTLMYAASKHAVLGLGRALRYITPNDGINCITLCPYFIDTPITAPIASLVARDPTAAISDFVAAASYASVSSPDTLPPSSLVFVHPRGVLVGRDAGIVGVGAGSGKERGRL
ncbi:NAD(P)-binding protein [Auriculariales sp. MPI-PUGE-AT-0066]|nr:NAD(P)-binding protein [Auriculariales sp. MPI-PUGE-AT-0066]